jgi:hypothetical protein
MTTIDDVVQITKEQLARHGQLPPRILLQGTRGSDATHLPDHAEPIKLSLLEAVGFRLATERRLGELVQLFLVAEGWLSRGTGNHPALRPQYAADRVDVVMITHYHLPEAVRRMAIYEIRRDAPGTRIALRPLVRPDDPGETASPPLEAIVRGFARGWGRGPEV